jgi:acetyl esterase
LRRLAITSALLLLCPALAACNRQPTPGNGAATTDGEASMSCSGIGAAVAALPGAKSYTYRAASGRALRIHVFSPPPHERPAPAILLFFGGGWRTGSVSALADQARAFAGRGYVAGLADYRVKCRDGTNPLDASADARAAYAWWRAHAARLGADPRRIVLSGGSAGGQLALMAAQDAPAGEEPAALVLFNPAVDLVGPAPWYQKLFARSISPSVLPVDHLPPTIVFHGLSDHRVPIGTVRAFCRRAAAQGRTCRIVSYRGQGHGFYHSDRIDPALGRSPYDDTMARAFHFLDARGITTWDPT